MTRDEYVPFIDISGLLGILAFSVAVFTLTSAKFQIRQATALVPFRPLFFGTLLISVGVTFAIEGAILFRLRIPVFLNPSAINYFISSAIAILVLYWMKICFISPPRFSRFTARNFFRQAYVHIANGSKEEMLALAREIMREAPRLIRHTPGIKRHTFEDGQQKKLSALQVHAHHLNSLLSDTRFCSLVSEEIPSFPAHMVEKAVELKRFDVPIHLMVKRTVLAMLSKPGSALFVENERLSQGFIGRAKPITSSIFRNWHLLEGYELGLESPLDLKFPYARTWDRDTWRVYFGLAREYVRGLASEGSSNWSARSIYSILQTTAEAFEQIGSHEKYENVFDPHNPLWHVREANDFLEFLVNEFNEDNGWVAFDRGDDFRYGRDLSSDIASIYFEAIFKAAQVNTENFRMWDVQHNLIWSPIEMGKHHDTIIMRMVRRKLRRMIWNEIKRMDRFPNYKGAAYVRFCLNVLGFYSEDFRRKDGLKRDSWPLAKVVGSWVRVNYQTLAKSHPPVAEAMLPANIKFDGVSQVLVRSNINPFTGVPQLSSFAIDPARTASDG